MAFTNQKPQKKTRKSSGHESVLLAVLRNNKRIEIKLIDGSVMTGYVKAYDAFTISFEDETSGQVSVFFKHGLISFRTL